MSDSNKIGDSAHVGLDTEVTPPAHPCPSCGVETKDINLQGWRFCSDCDTQVYQGLTEAQHSALLEEISGLKARIQTFEIMYKQADRELTEALKTLRERGII